MRWIILIILLPVLNVCDLQGQSWEFHAGYQNVTAKQWNRAIQTYNFSRPFLEEKQPNLAGAAQVGMSYLFKNKTPFRYGPGIQYAMVRSTAENGGETDRIQVQWPELVFHFRYYYSFRDSASGPSNALYIETAPGFSILTMERRIDGELQTVDDTEQRFTGYGVALHTQVGFSWRVSEKLALEPYFSYTYDPLINIPESPVLINQTENFDLREGTSAGRLRLGLAIRLIKAKTS